MDNYEYLRSIRIPDGIFFSKANPARQTRVLNIGEERDTDVEQDNVSPGWRAPSWPPQSEASGHSSSPSSLSSTPSSTAPYPPRSPPVTLQHVPQSTDARYSLPRLSTVAPPHHITPQSYPTRPVGSSGSAYSPLTPEDRKALNSFRVVL